MRTISAMAVCGLLLAACGGDDSGADGTAASVTDTTPDTAAPETTMPETTMAETPEATEPAEPDPTTTAAPVVGEELVGRWAHYDAVAYEDGVMKTLIISYGLDDFEEVNGEIVNTTRFCFSEQRTDQPIEIGLSDAATQAIVPPSTPVEVTEVDGELRLRREATPTPVGIRLDDPFNESLPDDPDDPRIVDDDGDGNPGVTATVKVSEDLTGELYIARREIFAYDAVLTGPDRLEGVVTDDSEQLVIGVSDPIFEGSGDKWEQYRDPEKNPIVLIRVDDTWDCARLADEYESLFPPPPTIDW